MVKDKRGVSLIELVVVIAIMGVMIGFISVSLNSITGARGRNCANKMEDALVSARLSALSKAGDHEVFVYRDSSSEVCVEYDGKIEKCGKRGVRVTYVVAGSSDEIELEGEAKLKLTYKQNTGSFTGAPIIERINVYASNYVFKLKLYKTTGKVEVIKEAISSD